MELHDIREILYRHQDEKYADFSAKLIPTVDRSRFIGVRTPEYKKIMKEIGDDPVVEEFLSVLPHDFHEENCLHSVWINKIRDYKTCLEALERFLPYVDNWAVCDGINPPCFKKNRQDLIGRVKKWIASNRTYTCRFGLHTLMTQFLEDDFRTEYLEQPADLRSDEYYVNMMRAWLFAEALTKQWESTIPFLSKDRLDPWTHNKTIQKACESFRITEEQKDLLRSMKRKNSTK